MWSLWRNESKGSLMSGRRRVAVDHFATLDWSRQLCPLCLSSTLDTYEQDRRRPYLVCRECALVFVPDQFLLTRDEEKAEYDFHQNDFNDEGYQQFLNRCYQPVIERIRPCSSGLDYGCGPGPLLARMLSNAGHDMSVYDIFYWPNESVLSGSYDFITCTEVIEHVTDAAALFPLWHSMLKPDGLLAIMTKRVASQARFKQWHYKNDPTHIRFYSDETFEWIAKKFDFSMVYISDDVVVLKLKC